MNQLVAGSPFRSANRLAPHTQTSSSNSLGNVLIVGGFSAARWRSLGSTLLIASGLGIRGSEVLPGSWSAYQVFDPDLPRLRAVVAGPRPGSRTGAALVEAGPGAVSGPRALGCWEIAPGSRRRG